MLRVNDPNSSDSNDRSHQAHPRQGRRVPRGREGYLLQSELVKAGGGTFLFIGPGPKGVGFKAMFKLRDSRADAEARAEAEPHRFEVGKTGWVTARFTAEEPLPKSVWEPWLDESYVVTTRK